MNDDHKDKVGRLDDALYSRTRYHDPQGNRSPIRPVESQGQETEVKEKWEQSPELSDLLAHERQEPEQNPFMKRFFAFAVFFFVATILVAGLIFLGGSNFVSSKNVDITVLGPTNVSAGETIELGVTIENDNNTDLSEVSFSVQYPQGARDPEDTAKSLTFTKDDVGTIGAGDEDVRNVKVVLIGGSGEVKQIKFSVEYKIKGSNATFYKDKIYDITIGSAPMTITVESPPTITSGDSFTTSVKLKLNSADPLKGVMLRAEYPYGYSVLSTTPEAISENNVWALGDFAPGAEKTIEIKGRLVGENQDERTFRFYAGVSDDGSFTRDFKSVIISSQNTVSIDRPTIGLSVSFNGDNSPVYLAPAGRNISTTIRYQNNLPHRLTNPRLELSLTGNTLDKDSVQIQNQGFYNSGNNKIIWSLANTSGVSELLPGQSGSVSFSFSSIPQEALPLGNRDIALKLTLTGTPVGERAVAVSEDRTVRIASQVSLSSKAFYSVGPFKNIGPIPPKVESETTYTLTWNVGNTQDDINGAKVTARLGPGVKWKAAYSENSEDISYDEPTNTVTWNMGSLTSGSGFSSSDREVAFQVSLTPSITQQGTSPILLSNIVFMGTDVLSTNTVTVTSSPLSTRLIHDPAFIQGDDIVVKK